MATLWGNTVKLWLHRKPWWSASCCIFLLAPGLRYSSTADRAHSCFHSVSGLPGHWAEKNSEWAQASTKVDIREQTRTNGRQLLSLLWNPGTQVIPMPVNTRVVGPGVLQRALSPQPFCDVFQSIKSISFRRNRRIIQSMSRKWVHFLISSGSKQDTTEHTWTLRSPKI